MDFARFLSTGELHDVIITVGSSDFRLHKFPLYVKSDYFRKLLVRRPADETGNDDTRSQVSRDSENDVEPVARFTLTDFPGGSETFRQVVAYCYNIRLDVTRRNACQLRCAAEYLLMTGPGNLAGIADRVLKETLSTAKFKRRLDTVTQLIRQCIKLGDIAVKANISTSCLEAIVDSWLLTSKYSTSQDLDLMEQLVRLPLAWFVELMRTARVRGVGTVQLATLIQLYITSAIQRHGSKEHRRRGVADEKTSELNGDVTMSTMTNGHGERNAKPTNEPRDENGNDDQEEKSSDGDDDVDAVVAANSEYGGGVSSAIGDYLSLEAMMLAQVGVDDGDEDDLEEPQDGISDAELRDFIDSLLTDVPEDEYSIFALALSTNWIIDTLAATDAIGCDKSRDVLIKLASFVVKDLDPYDLSQLEPDTFISVVTNTIAPVDYKQVSRAVEIYLKSMTEHGRLTVDIFRRVVETIPDDFRTNDDTFFDVLRTLLVSDELGGVSDSDRRVLIETIDYNRLSETALQLALDSKLIPAAFIAKAALKLCATLRTELAVANSVIQHQKIDFDSVIARARDSILLRELELVRSSATYGLLCDSPSRKYFNYRSSSNYYPGTSMTKTSSPYRSATGSGGLNSSGTRWQLPSYASNVELQLVLDSLNDDRNDGISGTGIYGAGTPSSGSRSSLLISPRVPLTAPSGGTTSSSTRWTTSHTNRR